MLKAADPLSALSAGIRAAKRGMPGPKDPLRRFTLLVALPAAGVYFGVCALVFATLAMMSAEMNGIEADRNRSAVAAVVDSLVTALGQSVSDEATWTEAYVNTYVQPNPAWLDATWGATARISQTYDTAILTDVSGSLTFGESSTGPLTGTLNDHFSAVPELLAELDRAVSVTGDDATVAGLARNDRGVVLIAGAVVHGNTGQASIPRELRRILWLARQIDDSMLRDTALRFQLPLPRITSEAKAGEASMPLRDVAGTPVATLAWVPRRPGDPAFNHTAGLATIVLILIGGLTFAVLAGFRGSIARRAEADEREWYRTRYDEVTGLYSRFGLEENLRGLLPRRRLDMPLAVAQIGVDGFTELLGAYGREAGDQLLDAMADRIEMVTGGQATLARNGPSEFVLARAGEEGMALLRAFSGKLLAMSSEPLKVGDLRLKTWLSIGIVGHVATRDTIPDVLRMSETALARAREAGGNYLIEYDANVEEERRRRRDLQADIRRGMEAEEFDLEYQPIIDFATRSVISVEALLRWNRRPQGPIGPAEFIPAAEASGQIDDLGMYALRRAIAEIAPLGDLKVSVNVSPLQLRNPSLAENILDLLHVGSMAAGRLQLEITETFLVAQPERAAKAIDALRDNGIAIALDDFGTGYSSIGYLRRFKFDRVKLDRSLIADIDHNAVQGALVESTMLYAFAMGLAVTAEGVERREEASVLARFGCREFQGYLFSRPLPIDQLIRMVDEESALSVG